MINFTELLKVRDILTEIDYVELTKRMDSYLPRFPISILDFKNASFQLGQRQYGGMNVLFRARVNENDVPWPLIEDISYIPERKKDKIKYFGRANRPNESIFYSSTSLESACMEMVSHGANSEFLRQNGSIMMTVGVWKINNAITLAHVVHSEKYFESLRKEFKDLNFKKVTLETVKKVNQHMKQLLDNNEEAFSISEFFAEEFAKANTLDHREYMLSNYYIDRVFNRNPRYNVKEKVDGIWYPSIPSAYDETNIALLPDVVDKKMQFIHAHNMWVVFFEGINKIEFIPIEQNIKADQEGRLQWRSQKIDSGIKDL